MKTFAKAFTMIELLIAVALLAVLITATAVGINGAHARALDAQRKRDLQAIQTALEDYYNDNSCYPDEDALDDCNSNAFAPYLRAVPCDPQTKLPYDYRPNAYDQCSGYLLLTTLQVENDPDTVSVPCSSDSNYGVSEGESLSTTDCDSYVQTGPSPSSSPASSPSPGSTPTPPPGPFDGPYGCGSGGECNVYSDPQGQGCPRSFATYAECDAVCPNPANECT